MPADVTTVILPNLIHVDDVHAKKYPGVLVRYLGDDWYRPEPAKWSAQFLPYVSRVEFQLAVGLYRSDRESPTWFTEWVKRDKIQRGLGLFWWVHGQLAEVPETSRPGYSLSKKNVDQHALVASIPKAVDMGYHSIVDSEDLAIATNTYSAGGYIHVGKRRLAWPIDHSETLPEYVPRRTKNDLRRISGNNPDSLAIIDGTSSETPEVEAELSG